MLKYKAYFNCQQTKENARCSQMPPKNDPMSLRSGKAGIAEKIVGNADRDVVFSVRILGESRDNLKQHFHDFIRAELEERDINFGDHPLLLPFIETHGHELTEFVTTGVALEHQLSLREFEKLAGDPMKLFRVDLWDSLSDHIEKAEAQFVSGIGGLRNILAAVAEERALQKSKGDDA